MAGVYDNASHPTSVMVRNLPSRATALDIRRMMDDLGFRGEYDFFHLPCRLSSSGSKRSYLNQGYGFVNFKSTLSCKLFMEMLASERITLRASTKTLSASYAHVQGLSALIQCTKKFKGPSEPWMEQPEPDQTKTLSLHEVPQVPSLSESPSAMQRFTPAYLPVEIAFSLTKLSHGTSFASSMPLPAFPCIRAPEPTTGFQGSPMRIEVDHEYYKDVAGAVVYSSW
eukprot:TRINITY_DN105161_c0_g1_i1.p1 TRINITY_DN105161_c0_g1~~TRINITY_DN105161_c0_g1_i1.p1  ORF type:complete len:245 (+),score=19.90 TRINITY_DN105161_c0_g1_i1:59-736(+)